MIKSDQNTGLVEVTQADREAVADVLFGLDLITANRLRELKGGAWDEHPTIQAFARHRIAAQVSFGEELAGMAKAGWISADYNAVGIVDADMAMELCEHIAAAIRDRIKALTA